MSIKPVDMQVLLPRSQEIQKSEIVKDSKTNINSQLNVAENTKETQKTSTQVIQTKQSELNNIKLKDDGKKGQHSSENEEKKQIKKTKHNDVDFIEPANLGNKIDIKI
ncbi:MAG: hypothetical protein PHD88_06155 [Firmicutes bacterium]|nr:hypothetical protein [Bacillota bacterium]MDD4264710.1 hypothetical protein [Bacillota bacterium]MDD4693964.1 hypothetical protein [Bacillota bacterium]